MFKNISLFVSLILLAPFSLMASVHDSLIDDLKVLSSEHMQGRKMHTLGAKRAAQYIALRYEEIGLASFNQAYIHHFTDSLAWTDIEGENVIAWVEGKSHPDQYIVVTAHYDHLGHKHGKLFYGADDNASGVAAMLRLAAHLNQNTPNYSYIFVATDGEETQLWGAKAFLRANLIPKAQIRLNINLDMIGQNKTRSELYLHGLKRSKPSHRVIRKKLATAMNTAPARIVFSEARPRKDKRNIDWLKASDHYAFYQQGIPYLYLGVATHAYYHTVQDTWQNMDLTFYSQVSDSVLQLVEQIDQLTKIELNALN
ncbi:M28 family peptidase [Catenovulum sp. SM1970]|uniref:M28 family peptidase n=1 Tax=Marinifaba aquimaris TaxID=2741323 RepID=UPI0015745F53|nr:M28 family peptidase [Marinifaba aquimaris]NTS77256.1 M28 family peptidase [Marinifaba aquimaris]